MNSLFDELSRKLEAEASERGISAWDLARLSPPLRKLMRVILREVEMTYPELCHVALEKPDEEGLTQEELDQALERLSERAWLVRMGQGDLISYKVNLRRRRGSQLGSLWEQFDRKIERGDVNKPDS